MDNRDIQDLDDDFVTNESGNRSFAEVLSTSRRTMLAGGLATAATGFLAPMAMARRSSSPSPAPGFTPMIGFRPVTLADGNGPEPAISPDWI